MMKQGFRFGIVALAIAVTAISSLTPSAFAQGPQLPVVSNLPASSTVDAKTAQALTDALSDEYKAHAFYEAVIAKFGAVAPFSNIVRAEAMHIQAVQSLMVRYNVPVPQDTAAGQIKVSATLSEAIQAGIDAEKANVAMYDSFDSIKEPDILAVFSQLREVSQTRHLPAFERALSYTGTTTGAMPGLGGFGRRWSR